MPSINECGRNPVYSGVLKHPWIRDKARDNKELKVIIVILLLTNNFELITVLSAPVAQWIRASASGAEGRRFESSQARQVFISC